MRNLTSLFFATLISCCSPSINQTPTSSPIPAASPQAGQAVLIPTPDILGTLVATAPSIEAMFDGKACSIEGSASITPGAHVISLNNTSGENAYLYVARHHAGYTWQDVLKEIGTPPALDAEERNIAIMRWDHMASVNERVSLRQYTFVIEAEYHIVVQGHGEFYGIWPCGPFYVEAAQ
jgi:hypothetical protein